MKEKAYKTMGGAGAMNIVIGCIAIIAGITTGVLLIVEGGKLLASRTKILL